MPAALQARDRIMKYVQIDNDGCWNWIGARDKRGYGRVTVNYKRMLAHRQSYCDFVGSIPDGLTLDHLCMNTSCVNPKHLEPVTHLENVQRAAHAGRMDRKSKNTHCRHGHKYTLENTRITPQGWRDCRTCGKLKMRRLRRKV